MKKWMGILLSLVILLTAMPVATYAEGYTFSDMPEDWSTEALEKAVENGLLLGSDGKIMPKENLTRAQMAAVINRAFGAELEASLDGFEDVETGKWYYEDMKKALAMGTFYGSDNMLNPDEPITREQAFAVIARSLSLEETESTPLGFTDLEDISSWAKEDVYALINNDYISGSNGKINPKDHITRAEFAQLMHSLVKNYASESLEDGISSLGNLMVNKPGLTISNATIIGDLIIGDGAGDLILKDVVVTGRILVRSGGINSELAKGSSKIKIDENSTIKNMLIKGSNIEVESAGQIENIDVDQTSSNIVINILKNGTVENIVVNKAGTLIKGQGQVDRVQANADDVVVETKSTKVSAKVGTKGVMAGEEKVEAGKSMVVAGEEKDEDKDDKDTSDDTPIYPVYPDLTARDYFLRNLDRELRSIDSSLASARIDGEDFIVEFKDDADIGDIEVAAEEIMRKIDKLTESAELEIVGKDYKVTSANARDIAKDILETNLESLAGSSQGFLNGEINIKEAYWARVVTSRSFVLSGDVIFRVR